jgi:hypothetical protein
VEDPQPAAGIKEEKKKEAEFGPISFAHGV